MIYIVAAAAGGPRGNINVVQLVIFNLLLN